MSPDHFPQRPHSGGAQTTIHQVRALDQLQKVYNEEHGLFASASPLYGDGVFGRDSAEAAEDLITSHPHIARSVIGVLAKLQGMEHDLLTEEEPGHIHHEYRSRLMRGQEVGEESQKILRELSLMWGGTENELCYYGSVDATPLFVRLVCRFCQLYPHEQLLEKIVERRRGGAMTIRDSMLFAIEWMERKMDESDIGLIEFKRTNPKGHPNPVWMDSPTSYVHADGTLPNYRSPIAAIEVQALAIDAFEGAATLLEQTHGGQAARWRTNAERLRATVMERFWMPEEEFFAMGLDRDIDGNIRQIRTQSSNVGLLLDTKFFDPLPIEQKQQIVRAIVKKLYGPAFLTPVGIRCRSLDFKDIVDFADYHGSYVSWVKQTYDISKGMRRHGFHELADQLDIRILNGMAIAGAPFEFLYVDDRNRVHYDPMEQRSVQGKREAIAGTNIPEGVQTWTVSALIAICHRFAEGNENRTQEPWQRELEEELLRNHPKVALLQSEEEIGRSFPTDYGFTIAVNQGVERDQKYRERLKDHF